MKKRLLHRNKAILWRFIGPGNNLITEGYTRVFYSRVKDIGKQLRSLENDLKEEHDESAWLSTNEFMIHTKKKAYWVFYNSGTLNCTEDHAEDEFAKTLPELKRMITAWVMRNKNVWNVEAYGDRLLNEIKEVTEGRDKT